MGYFEELQAGSELDHYRIEGLVAESGMASVFRATDESNGVQVALKIPHRAMEADPVLFDRFKREEEIGTRLHHPNVMGVFNGEKRSRIYLVLEWCPGRLLRNILSDEGKLTQERAIHITLGILHALEYIHKEGVVHRDLKPENIMVDEHDQIKLIDFGIASSAGAKRLTYAGFTAAIGTPDYISPEQVKGRRGDGRTDLYTTGIMLYEMLSGKKPFSGDTPMAIMNDRLLNHPMPPHIAEPSIGPQLQEILYRALERDPVKRYPTAKAFALDLENMDKVGVEDRIELREWEKRTSGVMRKFMIWGAVALIPFALFFLAVVMMRHK